ncbi:MAG: hypothetical protein JXR68_05075, partial [Bacteroidales bacterium]|nr:hypothetical protein [Bacteroidales bacterium]
VVVNSSVSSSQEVKYQNNKTIIEINEFTKINKNHNIEVKVIEALNLPEKSAGPGLARKIGMDLALKYFNSINLSSGIIVSLDADTTTQNNYFQAINDFFKQNYKIEAANIRFEHPTQGAKFSAETYRAIIIYELYLRYYIQALRHIKFPHAYHTIGSAFAVKADVYAKQGGMVLNKSGEDFYFLHKIIPNGNFGIINNTCVFPSPRITNRVIFGTGIAVEQIINKYNFIYPAYSLKSFLILKDFFDTIDILYEYNFKNVAKNLDEILSDFLFNNDIENVLTEIKQNTKNKENFIKRFFNWFNGFRVIKFLNHYHLYHKKENVYLEANKLIKILNYTEFNNEKELLMIYRKIQSE